MTTRVSLLSVIVVLVSSVGTLRADMATPSPASTAKPSSGSGVQLTRLMPSYTLSFLNAVGTDQSNRAAAEQAAGAVHLTGNEVCYAPMTIAFGNSGLTKGDTVVDGSLTGLGPGGDGSADIKPVPPPVSSNVPAPGALGLGILGMSCVASRRRGR